MPPDSANQALKNPRRLDQVVNACKRKHLARSTAKTYHLLDPRLRDVSTPGHDLPPLPGAGQQGSDGRAESISRALQNSGVGEVEQKPPLARRLKEPQPSLRGLKPTRREVIFADPQPAKSLAVSC